MLLHGALGRVQHVTPAELRAREFPVAVRPSVRRRLRHERGVLAGLASEVFTPHGWSGPQYTMLYLHGGGYIACSPATHRDLISRIALETGARTLAIDYRKAPEHPFPSAVDDCLCAYRSLLEEGVNPAALLVAGDSAGGALALSTLLGARDSGLPLPRAALLLSPWVDLTCVGESVRTNAPFDYLSPAGLDYAIEHYLQGHDPRDPRASPLYADLTGLPPLFLQTGSSELFYSENVSLAQRARAHGVSIEHEIVPGMVHVFGTFASYVPECRVAFRSIGAFVRALPPRDDARARPLERAL